MNPTFKQTVLDLLTSKKAIATAAAIVMYITGRIGLHVDPATLDRVFAAILVFVGAQGVADMGKSAALVKARADSATVSASRGSMVMLALLVGGLGIAGVAGTGCAAAQHGGTAVVDCTGGNAPGVVANILATVAAWSKDEASGGCRTATGIDWACVETAAIAKGEQIGGCALARLVQQMLSPPAGRAAPPIDAGALARATLEDYRAKHGGVTFHFATGDL